MEDNHATILMLAVSVNEWMGVAKRLTDADFDVTLTERRDAALKVLAEDDVDVFLCHLDYHGALEELAPTKNKRSIILVSSDGSEKRLPATGGNHPIVDVSEVVPYLVSHHVPHENSPSQ